MERWVIWMLVVPALVTAVWVGSIWLDAKLERKWVERSRNTLTDPHN